MDTCRSSSPTSIAAPLMGGNSCLKGPTMNTVHLNWISQRLRTLAPYLLVELLLPGGTLLALLLWLSQHGRFEPRHARPLGRRAHSSSVLRGMLRHTALPSARRS
jgi:hypothetical protein